jgi:hypothetical protein
MRKISFIYSMIMIDTGVRGSREVEIEFGSRGNEPLTALWPFCLQLTNSNDDDQTLLLCEMIRMSAIFSHLGGSRSKLGGVSKYFFHTCFGRPQRLTAYSWLFRLKISLLSSVAIFKMDVGNIYLKLSMALDYCTTIAVPGWLYFLLCLLPQGMKLGYRTLIIFL